MFLYSLSAILFLASETSSVYRYPEQADMAKSGEFPFIAAITKRKKEPVGTGNILSPYFVMTVCDKLRRSWDPEWRLLKNEVRYSSWRVIAGSLSNDEDDEGAQVRQVFYLENHPKCKVAGKYGNVYDAAVIKVSYPFELNDHVKPIPILKDQNLFNADVEKMITSGETCTVAGWGIYMYRKGEKWGINLNGIATAGETSPMLRKMEYQLIDVASCSDRNPAHDRFGWVFMKPSTDRICGFGKNKKGKLCDADEGAPLLCGGLLIGFFAQSAGCGTKWWDHPTVFTRLDMALHPWLMVYTNAKDGNVDGRNLELY